MSTLFSPDLEDIPWGVPHAGRLREVLTAETYMYEGRSISKKADRQNLDDFFKANVEELNACLLGQPSTRFYREFSATIRFLKVLVKEHGCEVVCRKAIKDLRGISVITKINIPDPDSLLPPPLVSRKYISCFYLRHGCYDGMFSNTRPDETLESVVARRNALFGRLVIPMPHHVREPVILKPAEIRARQTLRDLISEKEWRRYITNGFIMAKGRSSKWYQIKNDRSHTIVWEHNRKVKELCIVADHQCPPTDHVLTIKLMVELDEEAVWAGANQYAVGKQNETPEEAARAFEESAYRERLENQRRLSEAT